jgi:hypothetical protein
MHKRRLEVIHLPKATVGDQHEFAVLTSISPRMASVTIAQLEKRLRQREYSVQQILHQST